MRKKWQIIILTLLVTLPVISPGGWLETVLAICRVEMTDGSSMEGVIYVASATFDRYYHPNGFYLVHKYIGPDVINPVIGGKTVLFNTNFYALKPYAGVVEHSPMSQSGMSPSFRIQKAYYLRDITHKYYAGSPTEEVSLNSTDSSLILKCDFIDHAVWELLEYIPVFPKVAKEFWRGTAVKSVKELHIPITNIERFQLVLEPSEVWLTQIANVKAENDRELLKNKNAEDTPTPVWWHNFMKEKELFKDSFKPW